MISSTGTDRVRRAAVVLALVAFATPAAAQRPTREGTAQALFDEAAELFTRGEYAAACAKFQASDALDPKGGTLFNLALCREKEGKVASAWTAFTEARNRSLREGRPERVAFAEKKLAEILPLVPHLTVVDGPADGEVRIDGEPLPRAAWGTAVPIDPGEHHVEATAPQRRPWSSTIDLRRGASVTVSVPALAPVTERMAPLPVAATPSARPPSVLGFTLVGGGAAALAVGALFGVRAFDKRDEAETLCAQNRCGEGRAANDEGITSGWIANVGVGLGVVALGAGLWLLLRDPAPRPQARAR